VVAFKAFQNDTKMAFVQMSSLDESIVALVHLHNTALPVPGAASAEPQLTDKFLKVSFAKKPILVATE
jgi:hypothetical protein